MSIKDTPPLKNHHLSKLSAMVNFGPEKSEPVSTNQDFNTRVREIVKKLQDLNTRVERLNHK